MRRYISVAIVTVLFFTLFVSCKEEQKPYDPNAPQSIGEYTFVKFEHPTQRYTAFYPDVFGEPITDQQSGQLFLSNNDENSKLNGACILFSGAQNAQLDNADIAETFKKIYPEYLEITEGGGQIGLLCKSPEEGFLVYHFGYQLKETFIKFDFSFPENLKQELTPIIKYMTDKIVLSNKR